MNSWVWYQVSLELSNINVKSTIESQRSGEGGDNLGNKSVQVSVGWSFDIQLSSADIIKSFVIKHNSNIGVLQQRVSGEDGVVWFNNSGRNLWGWVNGETQLGLLTVIDGKSFQKKGSESGTGTTTDGGVDEESLKTSTVVSQLSDSIEAQVNDFSSDSVVTSSEIVSGVFLSGDELFWMEQLSVGTSSDLVNNSWFEIQEYGSWDVLSSSSFTEEGVESIITTTDGLVTWHLSIRLNSVLEAE